MSRNDCIVRALGPGQVNDLLLAYYQDNGATSDHLNDAEYEFLIAQGAAPGALSDMWINVLVGLGYEGSLSDMRNAFWCEGGGDIVIPPNLLLNSELDGNQGSVGGGDYVNPTGWNDSFWPPDDAIALGNGRLQFQTTANRGFHTQSLNTTGLVGQFLNASVFVESAVIPSQQRPIHVTGGASEVFNENDANGPGRKYSVYEITGDSVQVRLGVGTTAPSDQDVILYHPQVTLGAKLYPYQPTNATPINLDMSALAACMTSQGWTVINQTANQFTIQETGAIVTRLKMESCDFTGYIGPVQNDLQSCLQGLGLCI